MRTEPIDKWRSVISTPVRRAWTRRYLQWIGRERLAHMGYELSDLLARLNAHPVDRRGSCDDLARLAGSAGSELVKGLIPAHTPGRGTWRRLLGAISHKNGA